VSQGVAAEVGGHSVRSEGGDETRAADGGYVTAGYADRLAVASAHERSRAW
jgi:hypothetical protein